VPSDSPSKVDALWPDSDGAAGEEALATKLFRLRKLAGADVVKRHDGYLSLKAFECWVDCRDFERLLAANDKDAESLVARLKRLYAAHSCRAKKTHLGRCSFASACMLHHW